MNSYKVWIEGKNYKLLTIVHFKKNVREVRKFIPYVIDKSFKIAKIRKVKNAKKKTEQL